jgi:hypothetical protein
LRHLGATIIFGLVGVSISDIAEQAINLGIRFIGFRNEQAASYAATAYGYLTANQVCVWSLEVQVCFMQYLEYVIHLRTAEELSKGIFISSMLNKC